MTSLLPHGEAVRLADCAVSLAKRRDVVRDCVARLSKANSPTAVQACHHILLTLSRVMGCPEVHDEPMAYEPALARAHAARSLSEQCFVINECVLRLSRVNSALAVDSCVSILHGLLDAMGEPRITEPA